MRNLLATLLLSQGTPMLLAGDEFGRTQRGNNNAYAQDNDISWLDWSIAEDGAAQIDFVRRLIALRQAFPILRRSRFLTGEYNEDLDVKDVRWLTPSATDMVPEQWHDPNVRCFGMLMDGRAQATGIKRPSMDATALLVLNAYHDVVRFQLPDVVGGHVWRCLMDTNLPERTEAPRFESGDEFEVTGRSLLLFALEPESMRSVALTRARAALRQVSETPAPVALADAPAE
jgi:glycogen operon protein